MAYKVSGKLRYTSSLSSLLPTSQSVKPHPKTTQRNTPYKTKCKIKI